MKRVRTLGLTVMSSLSLASCSGGGGGGSTTPAPGQTPPPVVTRSFSFPAGDAVASKGTAWDIIGLKTTLSGSGNNSLGNSYDTLRVDVIFAQDVSSALPTPGTPLQLGRQIGVAIGLDTDANTSTGTGYTCDVSSTLRPFDYFTDPGNAPQRLADGNYSILVNGLPIYSGPPNPAAEAVLTANGNTLSYSFNLNTLGVFKRQLVPRIGVNAFVFNGSDQAETDCVPYGKNGAIEVFTSD